MAKVRKADRLHLRISADVAREIRQHSRSQSKTEVCGVLLGSEAEGLTSIEACISGENAAQGGAHVTFTQDTWEHIYKVKDRDFPDARIVGWYHSHPGFGVFLSDHDTFIHKTFSLRRNKLRGFTIPIPMKKGASAGTANASSASRALISSMPEAANSLAGRTGQTVRMLPLMIPTGMTFPNARPHRARTSTNSTTAAAMKSRASPTSSMPFFLTSPFSPLAQFWAGISFIGLSIWPWTRTRPSDRYS